METASRILIADDTPANVDLLSATLEPQGYEISIATSGERAVTVAEKSLPDLILLDVMLPDVDGFEVCRRLKQSETTRDIPIIFISARHETSSIVDGFQAGAVDYILKPFAQEEVLNRVGTHLQIARLHRSLLEKNRELAAEIERRERADARLSTYIDREEERLGFAGASPLLQKILQDVERLQQFDKTSVLVTGESGTGKELVARAVHRSSTRARGPFIPVNCVAVPAELAESLLFGHVRGAFTGATADRKGFFEQADGGTLFLDEIGDMSPTLQAKLLRVLEDGQITPIGSNQTRQVDVRVVAATNADLDAQIAAGHFRRDLYFRLARFTVETPSLRKRREDIPILAQHFLRLFSTEMSLKSPSITTEALASLSGYDYPGNIRELKNIIERALILSGGGEIGLEHLRLPGGSVPETPGKPAAIRSVEELPLNLEEAERLLIQRALEQTGGSVAEAARLLGVNRSRLYRRF